jgi:sec-independent protein translocase protein TatC
MPQKEKHTFDEKRMELTAHLAELRSRIMRSFLYVLLGAVIAYQAFPKIYGALYEPLQKETQIQNKERVKIVNPAGLLSKLATGEIPTKAEYDALVRDVHYIYEHPPMNAILSQSFKNFYDPFMGRLTMSLLFGLILAVPFVVWEMMLFVIPALTPQERRPFRLLIPLSALFMASGVYLGYRTMFYAMHWFLSYLDDYPQPAVVMQDPTSYLLFFVKLMAVFGIVFQLPIVLMGLAFMGLVTSKGLIRSWRWSVVLAAIGAMFVPSNDFVTMGLISGSIIFLYFISYFFVKFVERLREKYKEQDKKATDGL